MEERDGKNLNKILRERQRGGEKRKRRIRGEQNSRREKEIYRRCDRCIGKRNRTVMEE